MKNVWKSVLGVIGLTAGQASAIVLEEDLYKITLDTRTVEAVEVFREAYPDSAKNVELDGLLKELLRSDHMDNTFDSTEITVAWGKRHGKRAAGRRGHKGRRGHGPKGRRGHGKGRGKHGGY